MERYILDLTGVRVEQWPANIPVFLTKLPCCRQSSLLRKRCGAAEFALIEDEIPAGTMALIRQRVEEKHRRISGSDPDKNKPIGFDIWVLPHGAKLIRCTGYEWINKAD